MIGLSTNVCDAVSVCLETQPGGRLDKQLQPLSCRQMSHEYSNDNNNDKIMMMIIIMIIIKRFPAHDEPGTCRTSLVSPEQPVSCIPVHKHNLAINSGIKH